MPNQDGRETVCAVRVKFDVVCHIEGQLKVHCKKVQQESTPQILTSNRYDMFRRAESCGLIISFDIFRP